LQRSVLIEEIGEEHLFASLESALERAREELELRHLLGQTGKRVAVA